MTGVMLAWFIAIGFTAWNNGFRKKPPVWPPPYSFLNATLLFGGISLLARWNGRIAGLLALGLVLPMVLMELQGLPPITSYASSVVGGRTPQQIQTTGAQVQQAGAQLGTFGTQLGTSFDTVQPGGQLG